MENKLTEIFDSDKPDMEKLAEAFRWTTGSIIGFAEKEEELARISGTKEDLVKVQIKKESFKLARNIFSQQFIHITGKRAWDEEE